MIYPKSITINGGKKLSGEIEVSGSKNAALPVIIATLLCDSPSTLYNVPYIKDVIELIEIIEYMGGTCIWDKNLSQLTIDPRTVNKWDISGCERVSKLRYSILLLGPILAKFGKALVPAPGGCDFCDRPLDMHFFALELIGAEIEMRENYNIFAELKKINRFQYKVRQYSDEIAFIESILTLAPAICDEVLITNSPVEPEVECLVEFLKAANGNIRGYNAKEVLMKKSTFTGCEFKIIPDRIEAITHIITATTTNSDIVIKNVPIKSIYAPLKSLKQLGVSFDEKDGVISNISSKLKASEISTAQYPGFPTDAQPVIVPLLCITPGKSILRETIYENRFKNIDFFKSLGADIIEKGDSCPIFGQGRKYLEINGVEKLFCRDISIDAGTLRSGASYLIGGLMNNGKTTITTPENIMRGYTDIFKKYISIGADISIEY